MIITDDLLTVNPMSRPQRPLGKVTKIVVHYVGNPNTSAKANRNYFNNLKNQTVRYASSHYIVGLDGEIIRCIPDNEISYHAGNYNVNLHSIGIENCHEHEDGKFNEKTYHSLVELVAYLCDKFQLDPMKDVIRHYDVTKKMCPIYYVKNEDEWIQFKRDVSNISEVPTNVDKTDYNFVTGEKVNLSYEIDGYYSANAINPVTTVKSGSYYVYKIALGKLHEINISKDNGPGSWVDKEHLSK